MLLVFALLLDEPAEGLGRSVQGELLVRGRRDRRRPSSAGRPRPEARAAECEEGEFISHTTGVRREGGRRRGVW